MSALNWLYKPLTEGSRTQVSCSKGDHFLTLQDGTYEPCLITPPEAIVNPNKICYTEKASQACGFSERIYWAA